MIRSGERIIVNGRQNIEALALSQLGNGSFGRVWKASDVLTDRIFALKEFKNDISEYARKVSLANHERLIDLDHPNLVKVLDVDSEKGLICMEYLQGTNLEAEIKKKPLDLEITIRLLLGVLNGLTYLEDNERIHLDLKPQNIHISKRGIAILDFDLSRQTGDGRNLGIAGSPLYMSPEQAAGRRKLSTKSDVFSFGLIFYEMVAEAGEFHHRFDRYDADETRHSRSMYEEAIIEIKSVPAEVCKFIYGCLRKKHQERYSAKGALEQLERIQKKFAI